MRNGDFFITFTGKKFFPIDPHPDDICIEDIAHALSHICRFGGHTRSFYSVAQHSVIVSENCVSNPLLGLLHDATEAYVGDMVRPLKYSLPDYLVAEDRVWDAICERFNLSKLPSADVKNADDRALLTERRDLLTPTEFRWGIDDLGLSPFETKIEPLRPGLARALFQARLQQLAP